MTAAVHKAAAKATLHLPFKVPAKNFLSLKEAAGIAGISESSMEALYDRGEVTGNTHTKIRGEGARGTKRVLALSLAAYLVKTGDYTDESLADILVGCVPCLPPETRARLMIELRRAEGLPTVQSSEQRAASSEHGSAPRAATTFPPVAPAAAHDTARSAPLASSHPTPPRSAGGKNFN